MTTTQQASPAFRRGVLLVALALAVAEIMVFAMLWRVGRLVDPGADPQTGLWFIALGSALTLQAMAVVGVAWVMVAMSWTVLSDDLTGVSLEHPWRRWHGAWTEITHAWTQGGWLVLQVRGQWRRWYVRAPADRPAALAHVRAALPAGAWLEGSAKQLHLARTTLPICLAAIGVGGLILLWVLDTLRAV